MKTLTKILIYLLLCISSSQLVAKDTNHYKLRTFSPKGGFYYDGIQAIANDDNGFIWVLMEYNLFRFDGYTYKQYFSYFKDKESTTSWFFLDITTDNNNQLLVSTNNGLFRYNKDLDSFDLIHEDGVTQMNQPSDNKIIALYHSALREYNLESDTIRDIKRNGEQLSGITSTLIDKNHLYVALKDGKIYRGKIDNYDMELFVSLGTSSHIKKIKNNEEELWALCENNTLHRINIKTKDIEEVFELNKILKSTPTIKEFLIDKNKNIWLACQLGLYVLADDTHEVSLYNHLVSDPYSIPNNSVWALSEDLNRNIWIGTYSGMISYVNLDEKNNFISHPPQKGGLNYNIISSFCETPTHFWIGTEGAGINVMNKKTKNFDYIKSDGGINSLSYKHVKTMTVDKSERLWVGMFLGGIDCINPKTGEIKPFRTSSQKENNLLTNSVKKIVTDDTSGLWIMYQIDSLAMSYYSFKDDKLTHFHFDDGKSGHKLLDFARDSSGNIWIISYSKLFKIHANSQKIEKIDLNTDNPNYINAQSIIEKDGTIWIGTTGNGLIEYKTNAGTILFHSGILDYNAMSIYSMCFDDEGYLWIGSESGLFRYSPDHDEFLNFDEKDHIYGESYYPLASFKDSRGYLYFGGTDGFMQINPNGVKLNSVKPKPIITSFMVDNKPYDINSELSDLVSISDNKIVLDYTKNNFGFTFSSDNYLKPQKNKFRYRLVNYDKDFIEVGADARVALYSKVPDGKYTFEVYASNNDGVWCDEPVCIDIICKPAPWFSLPAYLIYVLITGIIIYWLVRESNNKKRMKLLHYQDQIEKEKKQELHDSQLRFFTNISHDLRTPLSLITASLDKIEKNGFERKYYGLLRHNTKRIHNLVNELMDFQSVENGLIHLKVEPVDINRFVGELANDFVDYADKKGIDFQLVLDHELNHEIYVDKLILEKIILNLLSNAFKYTLKGGSVSIETYRKRADFKSNYKDNYSEHQIDDITKYFSIAIRDTGIGITKDSIQDVFTRYYKVKTVNHSFHLGSGIGLALVNSFIRLHKSGVEIFSKREEGTDMVISLPTDKETYTKEEFLDQTDRDYQLLRSEGHNIDLQNLDLDLSTDITDITEDESDDVQQIATTTKNKRSLMLVEDNNDLRTVMKDYLKEDFQITEAENGAIALDLLDRTNIDLIVSDIMMPIMDGISFCKQVKQDVSLSYIPLILLTAKSDVESKFEGIDSGADAYFEKPIDLKLLRKALLNFINLQIKTKEYYENIYFANIETVPNNDIDNKFLNKVISIIDANIDNPELNVDFLTKEMAMSRTKLYNKLRGLTGISIIEFILKSRLKTAAKLIIESNLSITEIMLQVGFQNLSHFSKIFKKEFGESPSNFPNKNKA